MLINSAEYNLLAANMSCQWVICISWYEILRPCSEGTCNFVIISKWDNTITGFHSTQSQSALTIWAAHIFHSSKDISAARQQHSKALCFHVLKSSTGFVSNLAPPLKTMTLLRLVYMVKYTFLRHYKRVTLERAGQTPAKYQNNIINIEYFCGSDLSNINKLTTSNRSLRSEYYHGWSNTHGIAPRFNKNA